GGDLARGGHGTPPRHPDPAHGRGHQPGKGRMKRAVLLILLAAAPAAAQSFADGTPFGGSSLFSNGENPRANPARFDQMPEGFYLGADLGDLKPRGAHDAADKTLDAES